MATVTLCDTCNGLKKQTQPVIIEKRQYDICAPCRKEMKKGFKPRAGKPWAPVEVPTEEANPPGDPYPLTTREIPHEPGDIVTPPEEVPVAPLPEGSARGTRGPP